MRPGRRLALWVALAALIAAAAAAWYFSPTVLRGLVFFRPPVAREIVSAHEDISAVQARVDAALAALGASDGPSLARTTSERTDREGPWAIQLTRWELPLGTDAAELGGRLRALLSAQEPGSEVYVVRGEAGEVQVRAYTGPRLAAVVDIIPSLSPWPSLTPTQRPLLALVLTDIDADPFTARSSMAAGLPMAVALSPYSPFTLRLSRDALSTHTEVLAWAEPDATLSESLEGVPWATGVMVACAPRGDPEVEAALLAQADVYVLDATQAGLPTRWRAALDGAGVPVLRPLAYDPAESATAPARHRRAAVQRGGAVMALPVAAASTALDDLHAAAARGYRAAFPAEVVAAVPR
ncbi:MAG: hypothetical protein ABIO70_25375 [Pseudomonadota bacterium]